MSRSLYKHVLETCLEKQLNAQTIKIHKIALQAFEGNRTRQDEYISHITKKITGETLKTVDRELANNNNHTAIMREIIKLLLSNQSRDLVIDLAYINTNTSPIYHEEKHAYALTHGNEHSNAIKKEDQLFLDSIDRCIILAKKQITDLERRAQMANEEINHNNHTSIIIGIKDLKDIVSSVTFARNKLKEDLIASRTTKTRHFSYMDFIERHQHTMGNPFKLNNRMLSAMSSEQETRRKRLNSFCKTHRSHKAKRVLQFIGVGISNVIQTCTVVGAIYGAYRKSKGKSFSLFGKHAIGGPTQTGRRVKALTQLSMLAHQTHIAGRPQEHEATLRKQQERKRRNHEEKKYAGKFHH